MTEVEKGFIPEVATPALRPPLSRTVEEQLRELEDFQKATLNILEDIDVERGKMSDAQTATFNILEDLNTEKARLEDSQRATINILEDLNDEKEKVEQANLALERLSDKLTVSNEELEQFAYAASHDLQEPLRTVASYLQLLERRYGDKLDQNAFEYIAFAVDGANRMKDMVRDLLEYSRVGTRNEPFAPANVGEALKRALANLQWSVNQSGVRVTSDELPVVTADIIQLAQLLQNLIGNSIKFRSRDEDPWVHIAAQRQGEEWLFSVKDNGIGIDPDHFQYIFSIFHRLNVGKEYGGTGIGLAIAKRIVERHGGRIWPESAPGEGTTFFFTIPVRQPGA